MIGVTVIIKIIMHESKQLFKREKEEKKNKKGNEGQNSKNNKIFEYESFFFLLPFISNDTQAFTKHHYKLIQVVFETREFKTIKA